MSCFSALLRLACLVVFILLCNSVAAEARKVIVAKDGSGQFTTINGAMESVNDATRDSPVDIIIKPGVYAETITTRDWINLVGEHRETCVITHDGAPENIEREHTVWATTTTTIKNLTLIGLTVKYTIHSDGGSAYVLTIENCTLRREYPTARSRDYPAGFGIGLHADQHILMKNCLIEALVPVYWHNWNEQKSSCSMTLERCRLTGTVRAIKVSNLGSGQKDYYVLHDCILESDGPAIEYTNSRNVSGVSWNGQSETSLIGSGNKMGTVMGSTMQDDSAARQSGLELALLGKFGVRMEELYGFGAGRVQKPRFFCPVSTPGPYYLKMDIAENAIAFTCPGVAENPKTFGIAYGSDGVLIDMPVSLDIRMKLTPVAGGMAQLYYCFAPNYWGLTWTATKVFDMNNSSEAISVDTTSWQTYRLIARSPEDVRLYVEGVQGDGIKLKPSTHSAEYFQFRVLGHGTKVELESVKLAGLPSQ